jgi:hypothetical protein
MNRWVNESANGRLKNKWPFLKHTMEGRYVPNLMRFVRIGCALINAYSPPLFKDQDFHIQIIEESLNIDQDSTTSFMEELEERRLVRVTKKWKKAESTSLPSFPRLTLADLKTFTLGSYQLAIAEDYIKQHLDGSPNYGIFLHQSAEDIIRAQIQSRFSKSKTHNVWVRYEEGTDGLEGILERVCSCKVGLRSFGCCSHITSVCN